jgi:hypothetical protein
MDQQEAQAITRALDERSLQSQSLLLQRWDLRLLNETELSRFQPHVTNNRHSRGYSGPSNKIIELLVLPSDGIASILHAFDLDRVMLRLVE